VSNKAYALRLSLFLRQGHQRHGHPSGDSPSFTAREREIGDFGFTVLHRRCKATASDDLVGFDGNISDPGWEEATANVKRCGCSDDLCQDWWSLDLP
jgi:hypothetical protein